MKQEGMHDSIRIFIGAPFNEPHTLDSVLKILAQNIPDFTKAPIIHCTLLFMGSLEKNQLEELIKVVGCVIENFQEKNSNGFSGLTVRMAPELFGKNALALPVNDASGRLQALVDAIKKALDEQGNFDYKKYNDRPFRPHITLARAKGVDAQSVASLQLAQGLPQEVPFDLRSIVIYQSLQSEYKALAEFYLKV